MKRALALALLTLLFPACRGLHESAIRHRLVLSRFFAREVHRSWQEVDAALLALHSESVKPFCNLCVTSAENTADNTGRRYCVASLGERTCFVVKPSSPTTTRFVAEDVNPSSSVVRGVWLLLEPEVAARAEGADATELSSLALQEEEAFTPRWSFIAGAKVGATVSYDPPTFSFGGQAGFRYWGSLFVVPGALLEIDNNLQNGRSFITSHLQGRVELALWEASNARFFNLPRLSFVMGGGPVVGFGRAPSLGGRAVFGIHLEHLASFVTPLFFELGYQALEVDEQSSSGLRFALGLGF